MFELRESEVEGRCRLWQQRLKLMDWDIKVEIVTARDLGKLDTYGTVEWFLSRRCAYIKLVRPEDRPFNPCQEFDMEETLIHELVHLLMAPFDAEPDTSEQIAQQQAINAIAAALVKLSRN